MSKEENYVEREKGDARGCFEDIEKDREDGFRSQVMHAPVQLCVGQLGSTTVQSDERSRSGEDIIHGGLSPC
jgi:hypothetical protein